MWGKCLAGRGGHVEREVEDELRDLVVEELLRARLRRRAQKRPQTGGSTALEEPSPAEGVSREVSRECLGSV